MHVRTKPGMLSIMKYLMIFSCIMAFSVKGPRVFTSPSHTDGVSQAQIARLVAFGKAYGYVRYFYPANLEYADWEKICMKGITILKSDEKVDMVDALQKLFKPIAPEASFAIAASDDTQVIAKRKTKLVFHEYLGLNTGDKYSDFKNYLRTTYVDEGQKFPNKFLSSELAPNVYINMPLAASPSQTFLPAGYYDFTGLDSIDIMKSTWLCKAIVTWNIIQHFYPYREDIVDWEKMLFKSISSILSASGNNACKEAYMKMIVALSDGHAAYMDKENQSANFCLPLELIMIGNALFVKDTIGLGGNLQPGDEITAINGEPVAKLKEKADAVNSGGEGFKKQLFCLSLISGNKSDKAKIAYRRNTEEKFVTLTYELTPTRYNLLLVKKRPDSIFFDNRSIAYFDLRKWEYKELKKMIPAINKLKGVVFDLRGYPTADIDYLLQHLITKKDTASHWMSVPVVTMPDFKSVAFKTEGWELTPTNPRIETKTFFLCDSRTYSFAESILGFIKDYKLGTIIGESSAGANGDMSYFSFADKSSFSWSAVKVTTPTGKNYKTKGIDADILMMQTPISIASGLDLPLGKALEEIRK